MIIYIYIYGIKLKLCRLWTRGMVKLKASGLHGNGKVLEKEEHLSFFVSSVYAEQQPPIFIADTSSFPTLMVCPFGTVAASSPVSRAFLLTTWYIWVSTSVKAFSTFVDSRAEVSMKKVLSFSAYALASSVETARKWPKSALFPTSMITMLESVWSRSSFNHLSTFSNVTCRVTS